MTAHVHAVEAELLALARALFIPEGYAQVDSSLATSSTLATIGPTAKRILEDTLAKGIVKTLARLGGARSRIRPDIASAPSRVFEVREPPKLVFGPYTFELLRWLIQSPLVSRAVPALEATPKTIADELVAYLALRLVEGQRFASALALQPALRTPLTWLGFARSFSDAAFEGSFDALVASATIVECLELDLARRWTESTRWISTEELEPERAHRIVTNENAVLEAWLDAIERASRWDLAQFLVDAGASALRNTGVQELAARAAPRVVQEGALRIRAESRQRSGALFRALRRIGARRDVLAHVGFIDDGYDHAQATLQAWSALDRDAFARAADVVAALEVL
jgi:hypothetical protein